MLLSACSFSNWFFKVRKKNVLYSYVFITHRKKNACLLVIKYFCIAARVTYSIVARLKWRKNVHTYECIDKMWYVESLIITVIIIWCCCYFVYIRFWRVTNSKCRKKCNELAMYTNKYVMWNKLKVQVRMNGKNHNAKKKLFTQMSKVSFFHPFEVFLRYVWFVVVPFNASLCMSDCTRFQHSEKAYVFSVNFHIY